MASRKRRETENPTPRPTRRNVITQTNPNVLQHGVSSYLTMEEQSALASTSRTMHKTMAGAPDLKCSKETVHGIKCIRKGARRVIGPVCEEFCREHFMQGVKQLLTLLHGEIHWTFGEESITLRRGLIGVSDPGDPGVQSSFHHVLYDWQFNELQEVIDNDPYIRTGNFDLTVSFLLRSIPREEFQANAIFSTTTPEGLTVSLDPDRWRFSGGGDWHMIVMVFAIRDDIMVEEDEVMEA